MNRRGTYADEHEARRRAKGDRITHRPTRLRSLLDWATREYALEAPVRLHDRDVADDGAPDHTGEAKAYLGLSQGITDEEARDKGLVAGPNDWTKVARRLDRDGYFATPLRAAIAAVPNADRRAFLGALLCNEFTPLDVTQLYGIPDWAAGDVMHRSLTLLWEAYTDRPLPRQSGRSEAQLDAEAAA